MKKTKVLPLDTSKLAKKVCSNLNPLTGTERRHIKIQQTIFVNPTQIRELLRRELADQGYFAQDQDIDFRVEKLCEQPTFTGAHITIR